MSGMASRLPKPAVCKPTAVAQPKNETSVTNKPTSKENNRVQRNAIPNRLLKRNPLRRSLSADQIFIKSKCANVIKPIVRQPMKRPIGGTIVTDATKAKLVKTIAAPIVRIASKDSATAASTKPKLTKPAPYDYKARFALLSEKHAELKAKYTVLQTDQSEFETNRIAIITDRDNLRTYKGIAEVQIKELQEKVFAVTERNDTIAANYEAVRAKLSTATDELRTVVDTLGTLREQHDALRTRYERVETERNSTSECNAKLRTENESLVQRLQSGETLRKALHNRVQDLLGSIRVFCRIRPSLPDERAKTLCNINVEDDCTLAIKRSKETLDSARRDGKTEFVFDQVFDASAKQCLVFKDVAQLVQSAMDGYNVCVFAYGQTGSGKTFTMQGTDGDDIGIIPRTVNLIFDHLPEMQTLGWDFNIKATFLEVYNERIRDLLNPTDKSDHDVRMSDSKGSDVYVTNTLIVDIKSAEQLMSYIDKAQKNRSVAVTDYNEHSSRSHAITKIMLEGRNSETGETIFSSINLVDLAGSEKANIENSDRLAETKNINKSLSNLTNVILALIQKLDHVPYRNSKLTFMLMPCLGGNSKTLMLVNIPPFDECLGESIHSLRFASQVKTVKMTQVKKNRTNFNARL